MTTKAQADTCEPTKEPVSGGTDTPAEMGAQMVEFSQEDCAELARLFKRDAADFKVVSIKLTPIK